MPLEPGDKVVSAFSHRGYIVVITKYGNVYQLEISDLSNDLSIKMLYKR